MLVMKQLKETVIQESDLSVWDCYFTNWLNILKILVFIVLFQSCLH